MRIGTINCTGCKPANASNNSINSNTSDVSFNAHGLVTPKRISTPAQHSITTNIQHFFENLLAKTQGYELERDETGRVVRKIHHQKNVLTDRPEKRIQTLDANGKVIGFEIIPA